MGAMAQERMGKKRRAASWQSNALRALWALGLVMALASCGGGSGGADPTPNPINDGGSTSSPDNGQNGSTAAGFHAWWVDSQNRLRYQWSSKTEPTPVLALGESMGDTTRSNFSISRQGDLFIEYYWRVQTESTALHEYSASRVAQAHSEGNFTSVPREHFASIPGLILYQTLSHNGRYVAAIWAQDNYARIAKNVSLIVVDLWAPGGAKALHYSIPAGSEGIVGLPWISDHEFMYITSDLKVFRVDVSTTTYYGQGTAPAQFNGYKVVGINYSPDGQQVVGLMTRDGKTSEAFVAKSDFTNMRQLTQAGLVLNSATWMNASTVQLSNLEEGALSVFSGGAYISDCRNYLVPTTASIWNQAQVEASKPTNLPCQFQASD